jgi:cytochrome c peroxidase
MTPRHTLTARPHWSRRALPWAAASLLLLGGAFTLNHAQAQGADIFKDADLALGQKLIAENKCVACHISKVGGDGSAMYKPAGRINNAGLLRGMVEMCNTTMNLGLFPEEVTAVAAVLNRDHYKFK